jgi:signal transduction histidine kinase
MNKDLIRYYAVGLLLLFILSAAGYAVMDRFIGQTRQHIAQHTLQFWDALLTAHYDLHGHWGNLESLISQYETHPVLSLPSGGLQLWVWDAQRQPVYETEGTDPSGINPAMTIPLLHNGELVGSFFVREQSQSPTFVPLVFAAAMFLAGLLFLSLILRTMGSKLKFERERNRDLADALESSRKRINQLERVRSTMIADVAHELRNPLSTMRALTENALSQEQVLHANQLAVLHGEIRRMSKLINDLNQLALAESGHLRLEKTWFSLADLMRDTIEAMAPEAEESGLTLEWRNRSASSRLFGDRIRLQQVFVNLLANAIKYAHERIQVQLDDEDPATLRITVADDGIGIDEDDLSRIFDRFYRSSREKDGGLGLGLAIAKEFVNAHDGRIDVYSRWQEGTRFVVILPCFRE